MSVAEKYHLSKSQLLATWTLEDIFDALEYMQTQSEIEEECRKYSEEKQEKRKK